MHVRAEVAAKDREQDRGLARTKNRDPSADQARGTDVREQSRNCVMRARERLAEHHAIRWHGPRDWHERAGDLLGRTRGEHAIRESARAFDGRVRIEAGPGSGLWASR
jgi:hypothetical protein